MATPLPNRSIRIAPEHGDVLTSVLGLLRAGRADEVRSALSAMDSDDRQPVGPFRNATAALDVLLGRLVAAAHPQAIWLFGSRARGDHHADSDFDLLAIFPDGCDLDEKQTQLADAVTGVGVGVDVVACTDAEFERFRDTAGSLTRTVRAQGREVYVAPPERRRRKGQPP